ncbi:MAG: hypothetical protein Q8S84_07460 [bacterium]|nr:hypothetical protein [bacterium]MDP3381284.1 hypothetical protein [bacterium]
MKSHTLNNQLAPSSRGFDALCNILDTYTGLAGFDISAIFTASFHRDVIYK